MQSATQILFADLDMSPTPSPPRHTYLNLGEVAGPLIDLTHVDKEFLWANQHFEAFTKANELVSKAPTYVTLMYMRGSVSCRVLIWSWCSSDYLSL